jgi:hypothetical protein
MPSFSFLSDIDFRRPEDRELEDLQDIDLARHSTRTMSLLLNQMEAELDEGEEERPPTVFKCPVCSEAYPKESPSEYTNTVPSVQHRCSHGATTIFVTAPCPICMEDTYPTIALRCGHVLCRVDFERMGGVMGQPPTPELAPEPRQRRPRVVRGAEPSTNSMLRARSARRGGLRLQLPRQQLTRSSAEATYPREQQGAISGDDQDMDVEVEETPNNSTAGNNTNTNTNAVQVPFRVQLTRPTFLSRYLQDDSSTDSENDSEDGSNHTGASEDTERLLQSVAEYAARAADGNRQSTSSADPHDLDYGQVRRVPHTPPPREPTSRSSPAQWALTWPHQPPYVSRTRQEIAYISPMADYQQVHVDHRTFPTSPRITRQEYPVGRPRQGPTGSPFVDFHQFDDAIWDMSSSRRTADSVESPRIWALIPDLDDATKLELVHVGFSECFPCGEFPSGTRIFSADRDLVNCSNRICIQTPPGRNSRGSCRIRCIEVDHDDEEVDTVYEYSTPKTKEVANDVGNGVWALIQNRLCRFHREYPEGKQILNIVNCRLIADKESSAGWDPGNGVWVHSLHHREGVHTDLDPGLWHVAPNHCKRVIPNLHSRAKIIGSDEGLWILEPHSAILNQCLLRIFTVQGAVHEDFVVHVPFQHVHNMFMGGNARDEAEAVYPVRLHCRIRNQWSLCKVSRHDGNVHSYSECRKDSLVMGDRQGGAWVFRKPAGRREKKLYHIGDEGQVQEIERRWFPAGSILAI